LKHYDDITAQPVDETVRARQWMVRKHRQCGNTRRALIPGKSISSI
jgi:hypothetical protein